MLAEDTWLRRLDWKRATETGVGARLAEIDPDDASQEVIDPRDLDGDSAAGRALDAQLEDFSGVTAGDYFTRARSPCSIVVRNLAQRLGPPGGRWLAIHPALAERLGWRPAPDRLFRWLDADGAVRAESIC